MTTNSAEPETIVDTGLDLSLQPQYRITRNVDQVLIQVTEDKVRLALRDYLEAADGQRAWQTPGAVAIAVCLSLVTSSFRPWLLPSNTWQAVFIIVLVISLILTARSLYTNRRRMSVEDLISRLRGSAEAAALGGPIPGCKRP